MGKGRRQDGIGKKRLNPQGCSKKKTARLDRDDLRKRKKRGKKKKETKDMTQEESKKDKKKQKKKKKKRKEDPLQSLKA